jgi:hypothetical protein
MDGEPEGTQAHGRSRLRWTVVVVAVFAAYLGFRLIQGAIWLIGRF